MKTLVEIESEQTLYCPKCNKNIENCEICYTNFFDIQPIICENKKRHYCQECDETEYNEE